MKNIAAFSTLVASTLAQGYYTIMSTRSASPIHFATLQANGGKFYLGGTPSGYCPPEVGDVCKDYPGNTTVLAGGEGTLSLGVIVPGGQQGSHQVKLNFVNLLTIQQCTSALTEA